MKRISKIATLFCIVALAGCSDTILSTDQSTSADFAFEEAIAPPAEVATTLGKNTSTAMVQVIHNSPEKAARKVDVYVNGSLAIDNFKYRTATPFISLPTEVSVAIAPRNSSSVNDAIATFDYTLAEGESYVVTAAGLLSSSPSFDLYPFAPAKSTSGTDLISLAVFHGSPDAPTVDVVARDVATLIDDISFGEYQGYLDVPAAKYKLDITLADQSATAATFKADLRGLEGGAAVVLASGNLSGDDARFGLFAVLGDGTSVRLFQDRRTK